MKTQAFLRVHVLLFCDLIIFVDLCESFQYMAALMRRLFNNIVEKSPCKDEK